MQVAASNAALAASDAEAKLRCHYVDDRLRRKADNRRAPTCCIHRRAGRRTAVTRFLASTGQATRGSRDYLTRRSWLSQLAPLEPWTDRMGQHGHRSVPKSSKQHEATGDGGLVASCRSACTLPARPTCSRARAPRLSAPRPGRRSPEHAINCALGRVWAFSRTRRTVPSRLRTGPKAALFPAGAGCDGPTTIGLCCSSSAGLNASGLARRPSISAGIPGHVYGERRRESVHLLVLGGWILELAAS